MSTYNAVTARITQSEHCQSVQVPAGTTLFDIGDPCRKFIIVTSGSVRVDLLTETGRTIMLYRLHAGDTCTITSACLLGDSSYSASAISESPVEALVIPVQAFKTLMQEDSEFQAFVFQGFATRLASLMAKVSEVAFTPIDARLAARLLAIADGSDTISVTHDQLAADIGSAREVVSRKLLALERDGVVERGRGEVRLVDSVQLERIAAFLDRR